MSKKKKGKKKASALAIQKNKIRGLIASARSKAYAPVENNKAVTFKRRLANTMLGAREMLAPGSSKEFIEWADAQATSQLPGMASVPVDSELIAKAMNSDTVAKSFFEELNWVATRLAQQSDQVNQFLELARKVEVAALNQNWNDATHLLDRIDETFGTSIWTLEARIAITQLHKGLEAQKIIVGNLRKENSKSILTFLGRYFSIRNEPPTTLNSFFSDARERLGKLRDNENLKSFLRFKLLWNDRFTQKELAQVVVISQSFSLPDLYELSVAAAQHAFLWSQSRLIKPQLATWTAALVDIDDYRLAKLELLLGLDSGRALDQRARAASDAALAGQFNPVIRLALKELRTDPRNYRAAISAATVIGKVHHAKRAHRTVWSNLIKRISSVLSFGAEHASEILDLERALGNLSFSSSCRACLATLKAEMTTDPSVRSRLRKMAALNNPYAEAAEIDLYPKASNIATTIRNRASGLDEQLHLCFASKNELPAALHAHFRIYFEARLAEDIGDSLKLESLDQVAQASHVRPLTVVVRCLLLASLIESGRLDAAVASASSAYFDLDVPNSMLPLKRGFSELRWKHVKHLSAMLSLPIVLHLCLRISESDQTASNLRNAFSDFLVVNKIAAINQITAMGDLFRSAELVYFLRHVCVPEIIDMSSSVQSSRAAMEMRRDVCSLLGELDPENKELYDAETLEITRRLSVQDGIRVLDSSRVHVDVGAITTWATREWEPNMARYRALVESGIGVSESFEEVWKDLSTKQAVTRRFLEMPASDADLILVDMVSTLRNKFLLDPKHGLDSYLSRRVRHHSMSGYLRGVVEGLNLITAKDVNGRYLPNRHWASVLKTLPSTEFHVLQNALAKFSEDFDRNIEGLKLETFRIKSEDHPKGIFSIAITPAMYYMIRGMAQTNYSVETFCTVCYSIFWATLRLSLEAAQLQLKVATLNNIVSAFHRLKATLRRVPNGDEKFAEIFIAIGHASENLSREVVVIADWFNRAETVQSIQWFSLEQAIDICLESARHSYKPFAPKLKLDIDVARKISAFGLVLLSDLILTLLGNVRQHSHCGNSPNVAIILKSTGQSRFELYMESDISPASCSPAARERVELIRKEIGEGSYEDRIRLEGRSGLKKLAAMALQSPEGSIEFNFIGDTRFYVMVNFFTPENLELKAAQIEVPP